MRDSKRLATVVYISGPVTKGNRNHNVYQAFEAQRLLMAKGFSPINPIASTCFPFAWEDSFPHKLWMDCDLALVARSDVVLRLPGESRGADEECAFANDRGIPVLAGVESVLVWERDRKAAANANRRRASVKTA